MPSTQILPFVLHVRYEERLQVQIVIECMTIVTVATLTGERNLR